MLPSSWTATAAGRRSAVCRARRATPPARRASAVIATYCKEIGVDYLTVYAFSTENWKRPPEGRSTASCTYSSKYLHECIATMERDKKSGGWTARSYTCAAAWRCRALSPRSSRWRADGGALRRLPLLRRYARPRSSDPSGRGGAHIKLPFVAVCLFRVLFHNKADTEITTDELERVSDEHSAVTGRGLRMKNL